MVVQEMLDHSKTDIVASVIVLGGVVPQAHDEPVERFAAARRVRSMRNN